MKIPQLVSLTLEDLGDDARIVENYIEQLQARVKDLERIKSEWEQAVQPAHDYVDSAGIAKLGQSKVGALVESHKELQARVAELESDRDALAAHVARLKTACELARDNHNRMLMTDPPQCAWKYNQVTARLVEAIAATPATSLAERDAEVARRAYKQGFMDVWNDDFSTDFDEFSGLASYWANKYAERVRRGEV